jgi:hypothetical protein
MSSLVIGVLVCFILVREWQHHKIQAELINKLMSRNYHEYQVSQAVTLPQPTPETVIDPDFQPIQDPLLNQQLGVMTGIN